MLPYWLIFVLWSLGAVDSTKHENRHRQIIFFTASAAISGLLIGLRYQVGGDWEAYLRTYNEIYFLSLYDSLSLTDAGYAAINWFSAQIGWGVGLVNLVCAILFITGISRLSLLQPNPALSMLVAVPYLIIVVSMGYTRQAAAIGLVYIALSGSSEKQLPKILIFICLAALLHKTAILILPIALIPVLKKNIALGIFGFFLFVALFIFILKDSSDHLITSYVKGDYDSQGAAIRVSMNAMAGALFLALRNRMLFSKFEKSFWLSCSILSIISVGALGISSASSGIDRISLYLIPLQMVTFSRLPYVFSPRKIANPSIILLVIFYCFTVQFVWLNFADNSGYWVPYKSYISELYS